MSLIWNEIMCLIWTKVCSSYKCRHISHMNEVLSVTWMKGAMLSFICTLMSSCSSYELKSSLSYDWRHVVFAEYHLFHRALLHKRPIILRSLRIVVKFVIRLKTCASKGMKRAILLFIWSLMSSCPSYEMKSCFSHKWSYASHMTEVMSVIWMKGAILPLGGNTCIHMSSDGLMSLI